MPCKPIALAHSMSLYLHVHCELSLDPEVAILFGREIGQSNDDILLTIMMIARIKVGL
jgi:hypothetical protein